jgi:hypothetical protein
MRILLCTSVLLLGAANAFAQPPRAPVSPAIAALRDAVGRNPRDAESQFWARMQRDGAPLVESIPGDSANVLVTFLWRGDSATKNVALVNTAVASYEPAEALLARIPAPTSGTAAIPCGRMHGSSTSCP